MLSEIFKVAKQHRDNGKNIRICFYVMGEHIITHTPHKVMVDCIEFSHKTKSTDPDQRHYGFLKSGIFAAHVRNAIREAATNSTSFVVELADPRTPEGD